MPNEPISAAPQPTTVPAQSLRSTHAPSTWPTNAEILAALEPWMLQRRWFPLKGDAAPPLGSLRVIASWEPEEGVRDLVIAALRGNQAETGHRDGMVLLHVPVVLEAAEALDSFATPGEAPGNHGLLVTTDSPGSPTQVALVDGAHHPAFWRAWALSALEAGTVLGETGALAIAQRAPRLRVTTGEQSNTSVVLPAPTSEDADAGCLGEQDAATGDLIVKLLRVLEHGRNPDVELSVALARSGWDRVRTPVAWSTMTWTRMGGCGQPALEESTDSAVACSFVPRADDGFELFCSLASTDDVDGPVRARAVELARDLGRTTAQMHHHLAASLGTSRPPTPTELAASLRKRARWALEEVPELSGHIRALELKVEQALAPVSTGTTTWGRCFTRSTASSAGTSWTSRASPCAPWPSAPTPTCRPGTWPACCAPSTTPPPWARHPTPTGSPPCAPPSRRATAWDARRPARSPRRRRHPGTRSRPRPRTRRS